MAGKGVKPASCDVNIADHYALGVQLGVSGTPAIVLSNGYVVPGYQGPKEMKAFLMSIKNRPVVNNSRETTETTSSARG